MKRFLTLLLVSLSFSSLFAQENGGPYIPDESATLLMHFDNNTNNTASSGNDGIIHGPGVSYEAGIHGQCLRLDNSSAENPSWMEVPFYDELSFSDEFSVECWFKINSWGEMHNKFPILIKKGEGGQADYGMALNSENSSLNVNMNCVDDAYNRGAYVQTTDIIEAGKWYHIAMSFNFAHNHVYLVLRDENLQEVFANHKYCYTQAFSSTDKLFIGFSNSNDTYFDGWIDELRISNKYLSFRNDVISGINPSELKDSVPPLLRDKWKVYQWPLNAYYPLSSITGLLHNGNSCGITAMMRLIHYWEHPRFPVGAIDYNDGEFHWLADFEHSEYRFDEMPDSFGADPDQEEYDAAAAMVAELGAAAKYYHIGGGGAAVKTIMEKYFKYKPDLKFAYREEYTKEEWENLFKNELSHGRPILIEGTAERFDNGNWAGHYYVCDGYSSENKFHTDLSIGDIEWWTDIDNFEYGKNQCALIYAEPDWQGKSLTLGAPQGGEYFEKETEIEINWTSSLVDNVFIEYSADAGKNWQTISDHVDAALGSYNWTIPAIASNQYKIRVSDAEDGNIYQRSESFSVFEQQYIQFEYPQSNTYFQSGTQQSIYWQSEGIESFRLEYLHGTDWELLSDSIASSKGMLHLEIPNVDSPQTVLKATSRLNSELIFTSDTFRISSKPLIGGVYKKDERCILLLHFEETVDNAVQNSVLPKESRAPYKIFETNYDLQLGKAFRINNAEDADWHCLKTRHCEELNLGNTWTIETWVKYKDIGTPKTEYPLILEKGESFGIWMDGSENGFGGYAKFSDLSEANFFQNQHLEKDHWYHVSMSSNATTRKIDFYVHNESRELIYQDSRSFPSGIPGELNHSENDLFIGGVDGGSNIQFDGFLDELRITEETADYSSMGTNVRISEFDSEFTCYPNPLSTHSVIAFTLDQTEHVRLSIYDLQGRLVRILTDRVLDRGKHSIPLGTALPASGVYFCELSTGKGILTMKLIAK